MEKIKQKLREIYNNYMMKFEEICKEVIDSKYLNIFEEIYKFSLFMKFCDEPYLRTIIINTDQNANEFFDSMDNFSMCIFSMSFLHSMDFFFLWGGPTPFLGFDLNIKNIRLLLRMFLFTGKDLIRICR